jgi:hypothetical protein
LNGPADYYIANGTSGKSKLIVNSASANRMSSGEERSKTRGERDHSRSTWPFFPTVQERAAMRTWLCTPRCSQGDETAIADGV